MRTAELEAVLKSLSASCPSDAALQRAIKTLLTRLRGHEDMSIADLLQLFKSRRVSAPSKSVETAVDSTAVATKLAQVIEDDDAFEQALAEVASQRSVTKAVLADVFNVLFDRTGGVPKKATRAEIIRLIGDERHILVRNHKMGQLLGRRVIAAE